MKKLLITKIMAFAVMLCLACSLCLVPASAVAVTSKDLEYYHTTAEDVSNSIASIKNDGSWKNWLKVSEAEDGTLIRWKSSPRNVRVEANKKSLNLNGFHAIFSGLDGDTDTALALLFTERQAYSDFLDDVSSNNLARLPLVIAIDTKTGTVTVYTAKAFHSQNSTVLSTAIIENNENLKYDALKEKQWEVKISAVDMNPENEDELDLGWTISVAGQSATVEHSVLFDATSEIDFEKVYCAVNAWKQSNNNFSLIWNTVHGGDSTCADDPASAKLLSAANKLISNIDNIGAVTPERGSFIEGIRTSYDNMPLSAKSFIKNYEDFVVKENAYKVVAEIAKLGKASLSSGSVIEDIDADFAALTADEKLEVTNLNAYNAFKTDYQQLKLKELVERENIVEREVVVKGEEDKEFTTVIDVDGGTNITTVTKTLTMTGRDGTQYLWIIFTVAGVLLAAIATVFVIKFIKNKKRRGL